MDYDLGRVSRLWENVDFVSYNGKQIHVKAEGSRGWQESIFNDEIRGASQIDIHRDLSARERTFLEQKYRHLSAGQMTEMVGALTHIHTSEMVPYYIMRYGFYEGHTPYRADPIAIAFIFGLKRLEEIARAFDGHLDEALVPS
jgi:hypothetical protein